MSGMTEILQSNRSDRIEYLDAMRGFAMILVVYSHITFVTFHVNSAINFGFILFRMPLFFFLSGFLSYSTRYTTGKVWQKSRKRLRQQFLPTILIMLLYVVVFSINYDNGGSFFDERSLNRHIKNMQLGGKEGYWFTISMVETFLMFMVAEYIFLRLKIKDLNQTITLVVITGILLVMRFVMPELMKVKSMTYWIDLFSLNLTFRYAVFFWFGVLCKKYYDLFFKLFSIRWIPIVLIPVFVYFSMVMIRKHEGQIFGMSVMGIVMIFSLFYQLRKWLSSSTWVGRALIYIGKNTLEIYLLHYFIIAVLINIAIIKFAPLVNMVRNPYLEFIVVTAMSLLIVGVILLFNHFFKRYLPRTHKALFGQ